MLESARAPAAAPARAPAGGSLAMGPGSLRRPRRRWRPSRGAPRSRPAWRVLDVCAGLGGPARFLAHRFGVRVTGVDLTHSRCAAGARLTALVAARVPRPTRARRRAGASRSGPARLRRRGQPGGPAARARQGGGARGVRARAEARGPARLQRLGRPPAPRGQRAPASPRVDGRGEPAEHRRLSRAAGPRRLRRHRGGGSLRRVDRDLAASACGCTAACASRQWPGSARRATTSTTSSTRFFVGLVEAGKLGGARFSAAAGRAPS